MTTTTIKISKPVEYDIDLCFKCPCGCIHWVNFKRLKKGYDLDCYCGKVLKIEPMRVVPSYLSNQTKANESSQARKKVCRILAKQGYDKAERKVMVNGLNFDIKNIAELVKLALQKGKIEV